MFGHVATDSLLISLWCDEMKIDEKVVSYLESSNSPVDKEGYLYKKVNYISMYKTVFGINFLQINIFTRE